VQQLKAACPNGINVYFDNVSGPMFDAVTPQLAMQGKVVLCGMMSQYNRSDAWDGNNMGPFVGKRAQMIGLVVYDFEDRFDEFSKAATRLLHDGKLVIHEDRAEGLENAPAHFVKLMSGQNVGKAVVAIAPESAR
jgi:NADPH-dependent curcumin reductase CurA